jgi:hypothetical protein
MGDTPGVFMDSQFVGLLLQIPITITYTPGGDAKFLLMTTDVEIFTGMKHAVYWDWAPGTALPTPVGYIDDTDPIPGRREYHLLTVPAAGATKGPHTITLHVNPKAAEGMRDDFVLRRIEAGDTIGVKIGW